MKFIKRVLYVLLQWTFGLPQNIAGAAVYLFLTVFRKYSRENRFRYRNALGIRWKNYGSMGLGMFIFLGRMPAHAEQYILTHEYGHTLQSLILGPLFLPVIGIPSLLWASLPCFVNKRRRGEADYYRFYPERWANSLGRRAESGKRNGNSDKGRDRDRDRNKDRDKDRKKARPGLT